MRVCDRVCANIHSENQSHLLKLCTFFCLTRTNLFLQWDISWFLSLSYQREMLIFWMLIMWSHDARAPKIPKKMGIARSYRICNGFKLEEWVAKSWPGHFPSLQALNSQRGEQWGEFVSKMWTEPNMQRAGNWLLVFVYWRLLQIPVFFLSSVASFWKIDPSGLKRWEMRKVSRGAKSVAKTWLQNSWHFRWNHLTRIRRSNKITFFT